MKNLKICATVEARLASTRLPGKILYPLAGKSSLERIVERLHYSKHIDSVIVATTISPEDRLVKKLCEANGIFCFRGSVENILERLLGASEGFDIIVQATGDNPFVDYQIIDQAIQMLIDSNADFVCNNIEESYPRGIDVKVFTRKALLKIQELTTDPIDLVHGSYYFYRNQDKFTIKSFKAPSMHERPALRLTVDEPEDYLLAQHIYNMLYSKNPYFTLSDIIQLIDESKELKDINAMIKQKQATEG